MCVCVCVCVCEINFHMFQHTIDFVILTTLVPIMMTFFFT